MGQKTHPHGFRLGVIKDWKSRWYAEGDFPKLLQEDETIRQYLHRRLAHAAISRVEIERKPNKIVVTINTARPGVVIGKRGSEVDKIRDELKVLTESEISVNVEEVKRPELDAWLVAENVAHQIRQRISFRRAMRRAVQSAMRAGAEGIRIQCSGRLGGAEIRAGQGGDGVGDAVDGGGWKGSLPPWEPGVRIVCMPHVTSERLTEFLRVLPRVLREVTPAGRPA
jgi:small subunit ribosomal protein S3